MGNAVQRKYIRIEYPVVCMHQIEIHAAYHSLHEPCEKQRAQKAREMDGRNFMKFNPIRIGNPPVGKNVNLKVFIPGQAAGYFTDEPLPSADQAVFWHNNGNLRAAAASINFAVSIMGSSANYTWTSVRV